MHTILLANFNPALVFDLPEGAPPYEADDTAPDRTRSTMRNTCKQFPFLLKGNSIPAIKKESIFKTMLEGVYSEDAKVIIAAKDKKLTELFPEVTEELVREAIPNLLPAVKK
jgi:fructose-1-phosphate kinase PfkB-like protein